MAPWGITDFSSKVVFSWVVIATYYLCRYPKKCVISWYFNCQRVFQQGKWKRIWNMDYSVLFSGGGVTASRRKKSLCFMAILSKCDTRPELNLDTTFDVHLNCQVQNDPQICAPCPSRLPPLILYHMTYHMILSRQLLPPNQGIMILIHPQTHV